MPEIELRVFREPTGEVPLVDWMRALEGRDAKAHIVCLDRILRLVRVCRTA